MRIPLRASNYILAELKLGPKFILLQSNSLPCSYPEERWNSPLLPFKFGLLKRTPCYDCGILLVENRGPFKIVDGLSPHEFPVF